MGIKFEITKVLIAPNAFKDSLSAREVAEAIAKGIYAVMPSVSLTLLPVADGGTGTTEALILASGGKYLNVDEVHDPLGRKIKTFFAVLADEKTAVIEMANASGLPLLSPAERNPLKTSTFGTGELIRAALNSGFRHIIIGVGGSATTDAGVGAAQALGVKFFD
ncbi:MAG: glycerate kinase [Candidatus Sumerlaeia bacterium]|nr:glycerate kinase [Candidatus Sumerlaeia bacterium]